MLLLEQFSRATGHWVSFCFCRSRFLCAGFWNLNVGLFNVVLNTAQVKPVCGSDMANRPQVSTLSARSPGSVIGVTWVHACTYGCITEEETRKHESARVTSSSSPTVRRAVTLGVLGADRKHKVGEYDLQALATTVANWKACG